MRVEVEMWMSFRSKRDNLVGCSYRSKDGERLIVSRCCVSFAESI